MGKKKDHEPGKENKDSSGHSQKEGKDNKSKVTEKKKEAAKAPPIDVTEESAPWGSSLRPRPRAIFFVAFLLSCAWLLVSYDPCDMKKKKKKDCGYAGISPLECMTTACFMKGGGEPLKKKLTVERADGQRLGMSVSTQKDVLRVEAVSDGAVQVYNSNQSSDLDKILPGDNITKLDGASAASKMNKALEETTAKKVDVEIRRSKLPSYLKWVEALRTKGKPGLLERFLTSPGTARWWQASSYVGVVGMVFWFVSGYPPQSLPLYYFMLSGVIGFQTMRCCHDENVGQGQPHCYKGGVLKLEDAVAEAWVVTADMAEKAKAGILKDPKAYFMSFVF